jgi:hypothetical protein
MSNLYRGSSIDASYQVFGSFGHMVSEEKNQMWKVNRRWMPKAHMAFQPGELKKLSSWVLGPVGSI